jgi:hypothetical protein
VCYPSHRSIGVRSNDPVRAFFRRRTVFALGTVSLCGAIALLLARRERDALRVAVWQYQITSHSGFGGTQVCAGVRGAERNVRTMPADPAAGVVAALRSGGADVVPVSQCGDWATKLILGRVQYVSPWEATVEGSAPDGGYRYHAVRSQGHWRVRGAHMTWIR